MRVVHKWMPCLLRFSPCPPLPTQTLATELGLPFQGNELEGWCRPKRPYLNSVPKNMDESRPQQRASHRPATSYQPGPFLFPTTGNPHAHPFRNENGHLVGHSVQQPPTFVDVYPLGIHAGLSLLTAGSIVPLQPTGRVTKPMGRPGASRRTAPSC